MEPPSLYIDHTTIREGRDDPKLVSGLVGAVQNRCTVWTTVLQRGVSGVYKTFSIRWSRHLPANPCKWAFHIHRRKENRTIKEAPSEGGGIRAVNRKDETRGTPCCLAKRCVHSHSMEPPPSCDSLQGNCFTYIEG